MKRNVKKRIKKMMVNFFRQTRFFFEFSHYFDKYREKIVRIQKFYQQTLLTRLVLLIKLWNQECKAILVEDKHKKTVPKDMDVYQKKLAEGFNEVSLEDCILNSKPY